MRDDLTFHVLRIASIVASAHVGCAFIFSDQANFVFKQSDGRRARADTDENEDADSADASLPEVGGLKSEVRTVILRSQTSDPD